MKYVLLMYSSTSFLKLESHVLSFINSEDSLYNFLIELLGWQQSHFVFFTIFRASLLIQITNINHFCIDHFFQ